MRISQIRRKGSDLEQVRDGLDHTECLPGFMFRALTSRPGALLARGTHTKQPRQDMWSGSLGEAAHTSICWLPPSWFGYCSEPTSLPESRGCGWGGRCLTHLERVRLTCETVTISTLWHATAALRRRFPGGGSAPDVNPVMLAICVMSPWIVCLFCEIS